MGKTSATSKPGPVWNPERWWGLTVEYGDQKHPATIVPVDRVIITPKKPIVHYSQYIGGRPVLPEELELPMDDVVCVRVGRVI